MSLEMPLPLSLYINIHITYLYRYVILYTILVWNILHGSLWRVYINKPHKDYIFVTGMTQAMHEKGNKCVVNLWLVISNTCQDLVIFFRPNSIFNDRCKFIVCHQLQFQTKDLGSHII